MFSVGLKLKGLKNSGVPLRGPQPSTSVQSAQPIRSFARSAAIPGRAAHHRRSRRLTVEPAARTTETTNCCLIIASARLQSTRRIGVAISIRPGEGLFKRRNIASVLARAASLIIVINTTHWQNPISCCCAAATNRTFRCAVEPHARHRSFSAPVSDSPQRQALA